MTGHIIVCADDYGLTPGISRAIRMLAAANRISATSAIVTRPNWPREGEALRPLRPEIAAGLHLNLTLGRPLDSAYAQKVGNRFSSRNRLIAAALLGLLDRTLISNEIERQLDAFETAVGAPPDHVDGHGHVHVLPTIREALWAVLKRRYPGRPILLRDANPPHQQPGATACMKSSARAGTALLRALSRNMAQDAARHGFICNDRFIGHTNYEGTEASVLRDFSAASTLDGWRPLFACHPGFADAELAAIDRFADRRQLEFDTLMAVTPVIANTLKISRFNDGRIAWPAPAASTGGATA